MWDTVIGAGSLIVAALGVFFGYFSWKKQEIRHESVLQWSNEVIVCLQHMIIHLKHFYKDDKEGIFLMESVSKTSILIEQGRLFFKNQVVDDHGESKPNAYRGYRPEILDQILIAHLIALNWRGSSVEDRKLLLVSLEDCAKNFVSLAQQEVGRNRTACVETSRGGRHISIEYILDDAKRIAY